MIIALKMIMDLPFRWINLMHFWVKFLGLGEICKEIL
jgi:hypothetical protein